MGSPEIFPVFLYSLLLEPYLRVYTLGLATV